MRRIGRYLRVSRYSVVCVVTSGRRCSFRSRNTCLRRRSRRTGRTHAGPTGQVRSNRTRFRRTRRRTGRSSWLILSVGCRFRRWKMIRDVCLGRKRVGINAP